MTDGFGYVLGIRDVCLRLECWVYLGSGLQGAQGLASGEIGSKVLPYVDFIA